MIRTETICIHAPDLSNTEFHISCFFVKSLLIETLWNVILPSYRTAVKRFLTFFPSRLCRRRCRAMLPAVASEWLVRLTHNLMATERTRTAVILGTVIFVVAPVLGGLTLLGLKIRAHAAQRRALEELKATKPVEYYIQHTPLTQTGDDLRNAMPDVMAGVPVAVKRRLVSQRFSLPCAKFARKFYQRQPSARCTFIDIASRIVHGRTRKITQAST